MNEGARHASGDILWFVHADTAIEPEALDQIRAALADPPWPEAGSPSASTAGHPP